MKNYTLKYGKGEVSFSINEKDVLGELYGSPVTPISDIPAALKASLNAPIDSPSLSSYLNKGDKTALIVSDMSRFWMRQDLVIPHLVSAINDAGIPDEDITIVIANGTHPGGSEHDLRTIVTDAVYDRIRVINHDHQGALTNIGTTSFGTEVWIDPVAAAADKVICLGACAHHVMAGFGGGRKSILPGISGAETIRQNHLHSLDMTVPRSNPLIGNGRLEGNPMNEDMCEAAGFMKSLFMVNLVFNADMKLAHIFSGHWHKSWLKACEVTDAIYSVPIREKADVVITSCGGYPKDMSLYQGTKTIDNVESGLKEGGTLIVAMEAIEGGGPAQYFDWIEPLKQGRLYESLKAGFTIPGYVFFLNCEQALKYRIMLLTSVAPDVVAPMGVEAYNDMDSLLSAAGLEGKSIYIIPNGATVIPTVKG